MNYLVVAIFSLLPHAALAQTMVGIAPRFEDVQLLEGRTATVRGSSALLYNPAGLAKNYYDLNAVQAYQILDHEAVKQSHRQLSAQDSQNRSSPDPLGEITKQIQNGQEYLADAGVSAAEVAMPYFAAHVFSHARVGFQTTDAGTAEERQNSSGKARLGYIVGGALRLGKFSAGYSQYQLAQGGYEISLTNQELNSLQSDLASGRYNEDNFPYEQYADFTYGKGIGHNAGLMFNPIDNNISGIGVSVLNVGGTKFDKSNVGGGASFAKEEKKFQDSAAEKGITLQAPAEIPQVVNIGLGVGYGCLFMDITCANLNVDLQDVGGATIDNKVVISAEFGLRATQKSMEYSSVNWKTQSGFQGNVGFQGLFLRTAVRPSETATVSAGTIISSTTHRLVALGGSFEGYREVALDEKYRTRDGSGFLVGFFLLY